MIISKLTGGLGNQMFQYAAGLALAKRQRTVLKLDVGWYTFRADHQRHDRYGMDCFACPIHWATGPEVRAVCNRSAKLTTKILRRIRGDGPFGWGVYHKAKSLVPYDEFYQLPDNTYLEGNWQSEGFFAGVEEDLRRHFVFRYPLASSAADVAGRIRQDPFAVAMHIRRGDYVNGRLNPECRALETDYYREALAEIRRRVRAPTVYLFSDEVEAVSKEWSGDGRVVPIVPGPDWMDFDELQLMGLCKYDIISNSTFSWWAAWLNPHAEKVVIAPDPWFADPKRDGSAVVPKGWLRLTARHIGSA